MRSKASHIIDIESVVLSAEDCTVNFPKQDKYISEKLLAITRKHSVSREAGILDEAAVGDIAILRLVSTLTKFNKPSVTINVGKNFFSRDVEKAVVGMKLHEVRKIQIENTDVEISLIKFSKRDVPGISDKMIVDEEIPGIDTVEKYVNYIYSHDLYETSMKELYFRSYNKILDEMMAKAEFIIDPEELETYLHDELEKIKNSASKDPEKYSKFLQGYIGRTTIRNLDEMMSYIGKDFPVEEMEEKFQEAAILEFRKKLLATAFFEKEGITFTPEYYLTAIAEYAEMTGTARDKMEEQLPYERFIQFNESEFTRKILYYLLTQKRIVKEEN